jgi:hypothetical protein
MRKVRRPRTDLAHEKHGVQVRQVVAYRRRAHGQAIGQIRHHQRCSGSARDQFQQLGQHVPALDVGKVLKIPY